MWKRYRPHRRGEQCSPGLTPLPCRASPLKRRQFEKASSYRGGGTKCRRSDTPTGESCSPGLTPLPCRASPLKRRQFEKASSLEEVARSAGGVTHHRENNVRPYRVVSHIDSGVWNGQLVTADRCGHLSLQKYHKTETLQNVQNPRPIVGANIIRPG